MIIRVRTIITILSRNGIDGCDFAKNCPLTAGDLDLKVIISSYFIILSIDIFQIELDLSPYSNIISMLTANVSDYCRIDCLGTVSYDISPWLNANVSDYRSFNYWVTVSCGINN